MKNTVKKNVFFRYDVMDAKIVGSKSAFDKANRGYGDAYEELMRMKNEHPDYTYQIAERNSSKTTKSTYKGLNRELIFEYISIQKDSDSLKKELEKIESLAKSKWPETKRWFLSKYPDFRVENAKREIAVLAGQKDTAASIELSVLPEKTAV